MTRRSIEDVLRDHTGDERPTAAKARKAAKEIRSRADRFGKAAVSDQLLADAKRMDEYASGIELGKIEKELGVGESNTPSPITEGDAKKKAKKPGKRKKPARRPTSRKKRGGKIGAATRYATVGAPEQAIAGGIRTAGDLVWTFLMLLIGVGLLALVLSNPGRLAALGDWTGAQFERFVDPWSADKAAGKVPTSSTNTTARPQLVRV